jgi:hypothetical protein
MKKPVNGSRTTCTNIITNVLTRVLAGCVRASRFQGIIGETSRIESELSGKGIDFSRGYLVFKMFEHTISIVCNGGGLQVFLDGDLLKREPSVQSSPD